MITAMPLHDRIRDVVAHHSLGVLATHTKGFPHTSLVAVLLAEGLDYLYFATPRTTQKYRNMQSDERVALFFDNRPLVQDARDGVVAITAYGFAKEISPALRLPLERAYEAAHPEQGFFLHQQESALVQVEVERWTLVTRFQEIQEYWLRPEANRSE